MKCTECSRNEATHRLLGQVALLRQSRKKRVEYHPWDSFNILLGTYTMPDGRTAIELIQSPLSEEFFVNLWDKQKGCIFAGSLSDLAKIIKEISN